MPHGTVVLLGSLPASALPPLLQEFDWTLETAADLKQLREISPTLNPIAILFDANSLKLSWKRELRSIREIDPHALLIPCHRFSDMITWRDLADNGAFHALALPFNPSEVRQSLSFVWSARLHRVADVVGSAGRNAMPASTAEVASPRASV
jgi:DNA-binding NtrC family response regulator